MKPGDMVCCYREVRLYDKGIGGDGGLEVAKLENGRIGLIVAVEKTAVIPTINIALVMTSRGKMGWVWVDLIADGVVPA